VFFNIPKNHPSIWKFPGKLLYLENYSYSDYLEVIHMKRQILIAIILTLMVILIFSSCAPGSGRHHAEKKAGFFTGIWHGWIAPITLIIGIFKPAIRVYEKFNTGWWYDFGFYIAVISGFGGLSLTRRRKKSSKSV
jgi:hypothetical protein